MHNNGKKKKSSKYTRNLKVISHSQYLLLLPSLLSPREHDGTLNTSYVAAVYAQSHKVTKKNLWDTP